MQVPQQTLARDTPQGVAPQPNVGQLKLAAVFEHQCYLQQGLSFHAPSSAERLKCTKLLVQAIIVESRNTKG